MSSLNKGKNIKGFMVFEVVFSIALIALLCYPTLNLMMQYRNTLIPQPLGVTVALGDFFEPRIGYKSCDEFLYSLQIAYRKYKNNTGKQTGDLLDELDFNLQNLVQVTSYSGQTMGFGSTSAITNVQIYNNRLVASLNSASSSDPDIISVDISDLFKNSDTATFSKLDTGPGISGISLTNQALFAADTSVTDAVQKITYGTSTLTLLNRYSIPKLSASYGVVAKSIESTGQYVLVGLEKNIGPEIYFFDSVTGQIKASVETGYGVTRMKARGNRLFVFGPSDPEIDIFEIITSPSSASVSVQKVASYDAPGLSGNGRSVDFYNDELIFGRSRGNEEFSVLRIFNQNERAFYNPSDPELIHSLKISASIDSVIAASSSVFQITSDQLKEFQLITYKPNKPGDTVHRAAYLDLPSRANDFVCTEDTVLVGAVDPAVTFTKIKIKDN